MIAHQVTVQHQVLDLVGVAHEAVVTGRFAVLRRPRSAAAVRPRDRVEVALVEGSASHLGQGTGVVHQVAQHTGAPLGRLVDQQDPRRRAGQHPGSFPVVGHRGAA